MQPTEGELAVYHAHDHDQTMRRQVVLYGPRTQANPTVVLGPLYDPVLMAGGGEALLFRGLVLEDSGEVAQEWWVRVVP